MRELKFRCHTDQRVFDVPSESFSLSIHDTGHAILVWASDGIIDEIPVKHTRKDSGLKDKNGVRMYEWVILTYDEALEYCAIEWMDAGFNGREPCSGAMQHACELIDCEVIGNIHQNADLLK